MTMSIQMQVPVQVPERDFIQVVRPGQVLDPNLMILAQGKKLRELNMAERPK
jgi:hypothetical protein